MEKITPYKKSRPHLNYHHILKENRGVAVESYEKLVDEMRRERLLYKDKTIPVLIQPYFIEKNFFDELSEIIEPIEKGLNRIIDIVLGRYDKESFSTKDKLLVSEIKDAFGLSETETELAKLNCGTDRHIIIHRLDLYSGKKHSILEFNTDSAAGILETDMQIRLFKSLEPFRQLARDFPIRETDGARKILEALLNSDYSGKSAGEAPTICLTDWSDVGTKSEQENMAEYFSKLDYKTFLADPREFMYKDKALRFKDEKIHIVHRRVIMSELVERINEVQPLVQAVRDGAVSVVNSFSSALGSNKVILTILSEGKFHPLLESDTVAVMNEYLPWTRLFHRTIDNALLSKIVENKNSYVLKKGISYGGSAVVVGRGVNKEQWKTLTEKILTSPEERWIVQKYVTPPREVYPVIREGDLKFQELIFNINPFIIEGEYVNGMARLSFPDRHVINVAKGGFQVPMLQIDEK